MAKIYVANTSKQVHLLNYRLPKEINKDSGRLVWGREFSETIPPGGQVLLCGGRDFSDFEFKTLMDHHGDRYGAVRPNEYKRGFVGQIWDDKPIKIDAINEGIQGNEDAALARAEKIQTDTAAASLDKEQKRAQETGSPQPRRVDLEVVPESGKGQSAAPGRGAEAVADGVAPKNGGK